jgi:uncharacterized membrane protein YphA (DoxX/SURF4 family)
VNPLRETSRHPYGSRVSLGARAPSLTGHLALNLDLAKREGWETMNNLDRFMEFVVAAVFVLAGLSKIFSYRSQRESGEEGAGELAIEFPYWCVALVGLFEMAAAMLLITPFELTLFAAVALGLSTMITGLYRVSVQKPIVQSAVLFLLVLFVIRGHVF